MASTRIPFDKLGAAELEKLRAMARARGVKKREQSDDSIPRIDRDGPLPLSFMQQSLWLVAQVSGADTIYHIPNALRLHGKLDTVALRNSLDAVFANHDALRSTFVAADEQLHVQLLPVSHGVPLLEHDLRGEASVQDRLQELSAEEAREPFDLAQGPMIRTRLIRLADQEYIFLLTIHHIIADGWSMALFARELGVHYRRFCEGTADIFDTPTVQYPDYAAWQRTRLAGERMQKLVGYWQSQLAGAPAFLELPTDYPRPARQDYAGAFLPIVIEPVLTQALKRFNQKHGVTLFMTVMAAWSVVLARYSGQRDLVIGTPTANRMRPDIDATIGCFINTLALRMDLTDDPSLAELVTRVRNIAAAAQEHQELPFEQVVEIVQPPRMLDRTALFQVMFTWQNSDRSVPDLAGMEVSAVDVAHEVSRYDMKLDLYEEGDGIAGGLIYATALFDAQTMIRHRGYLLNVLRAMVGDDACQVSKVALIDADEQSQLAAWNASERDFAGEATLAGLFEAQVARTPHAMAVEAQGQCLTYEQLNLQANRLAHYLAERGVGPDVRVAVCAERSVGLVIGLLAILKAGGAYVPLDPVYSSDRLGQILADAGAIMLLADEYGRVALGEAIHAMEDVLVLDGAGQANHAAPWNSYSTANPSREDLTSGHLAYVIYTSGSTGTPKGVMVEQRSVVNFWSAIRGLIYPADTSGWRVGWNASFSFDMSIKAFSQLLSGHTLVLIPQEVRAYAPALATFLEQQRIDAFDTTPSQLRALLDTGWLDKVGRPYTVLLGGEAISADMWSRLTQAENLRCFNMYGPTECTVDATVGHMRAEDMPPHIGWPLANMRIHLLDAQGQPVPHGAIGEIYIAGAGVARGYLNQPVLTAQRFIQDPFAGQVGARMYRTGDLGRLLLDGRIEYLGRNDQQVKVRGFRIELGEIEARLTEHGQVRDAVVIAMEEPGGDNRLVAYVIAPEAAAENLAASLRTHLAERLPDYMLPAAYVPVEAWPLTRNGKLDRGALPSPEQYAFASRAYEAPQEGMEQVLANMWCELLGVEQVGRQDHFFELGGHSLLAVRLLVRIRQTLEAELSIATLFANPVLAELAAVVLEARQQKQLAQIPAIELVARDQPLPLSFAQQRLWFLAQIEGVSANYHIPNALRLRGVLDRAALASALNALLARHEALRSVFVRQDKGPVLNLLAAEQCLPLRVEDFQGKTDKDLAAFVSAEVNAPFDLATGPLIRACLIRLSDEEHVFLLIQHHIVSDGWSMGILIDELGELYRAFHQAEPASLPPLPIQYPDFAAWQRQWLSGERLHQQMEYWRKALAGAPALLELPTDRPRPAIQHFAGGTVPIVIGAKTVTALKELSQRHDVTLFMSLLSAWALVLARLAGQDEVVIGSPVANRRHPATEGLIGCFVNSLALRVDLSGQPSLAELIARVRQTTLAAQDHQDLPFEQVVDIIQPPRRLNHTPLFQVMFSWQNNQRGEPNLCGLEVEHAGLDYAVTKFDLELFLGERHGEIVGGLNYATALFDEKTIQRHVAYLVNTLQAMAEDDSWLVGKLDFLPPAERSYLLHEWNDTAIPYARETCIHHLFEAQVQKTPDALAVVCGDNQLSYAQLNAQANQIARHLRSRGLRQGALAGVCLSRGPMMVVSLLAVLKAGGAYVPIDPHYPAHRIDQMLSDAAPDIVICDASGRDAVLAAGVAESVLLDLQRPEQWAGLAAENLGAQEVQISSDRLAYVIYTSGSTGTPKGVMGTHRPMINLIEWINREFGVGTDDVLLLTSSLCFDLSVYDIFGMLAVGGQIRIALEEDLIDPRRIVQMLFEQDVTFWDSAPAVFHQLVSSLHAFDGGQHIPPLRLAFFSGDWIPLELFGVLKKYFPHCRMIGLGGATEATVWSNFFRVEAMDAGWVSIPYGKPIANARYYVLDENRQQVPWGSRGDLYIGGECLTAGYFNREALTAERFVHDPYGLTADARMYKTGDLARHLQDGNLQFLGRNDNQVKIRGFRIELGEIEARLIDHPKVRDAVVLARGESSREKRLVAYVISAVASEANAEDAGDFITGLRSHLFACLPEYMVPAAFVRVESFPLTSNGKLDRQALPSPDETAYARRVYESPQGEVEQLLAGVWQELLSIEQVGRHDHFFELGGHSLLAVSMIDRLRRENLRMDIRHLFAQPVLSELARHIDDNAVEAFRI